MRDTGRLRAFMIRLGAVASSSVLLAQVGCTVGPDYVEPPRAEPDAWHRELADGLSAGESVSQRWWAVFADPTIESLIQRAQSASPRLQEAWARVDEARALRGVAAGERFPDLDGAGFANRGRVSEGTTPIVPSPLSRVDDLLGLSVDASWELDVFGRIARQIESDQASFEASEEDLRDVRVTLLAEVARSYISVRALQMQLKSAEENLASQKTILELTRSRAANGISSDLDLKRSESLYAASEAALRKLDSISSDDSTRRIPRPPPPAVALSISG